MDKYTSVNKGEKEASSPDLILPKVLRFFGIWQDKAKEGGEGPRRPKSAIVLRRLKKAGLDVTSKDGDLSATETRKLMIYFHMEVLIIRQSTKENDYSDLLVSFSNFRMKRLK